MASGEARFARARTLVAWLALAVLAGKAVAQPATGGQRVSPSPLDSAVSVPGPRYDSALRGFPRAVGQTLLPWRDVNGVVRDVGGHAGSLRGEPPEAGARAPSTPLRGDGRPAAPGDGMSDGLQTQ